MSYFTEEEYNKLWETPGHVSFFTQVPYCNADKAEELINKYRELHRELGDVFVGHTCACNDDHDLTVWRFLYKAATEEEELYIFRRRDALYRAVFAEEIASGLAAEAVATASSSGPAPGSPCVCPFSLV